jgi:transcriptional regulator with XRE-family HTH domain
VKSWNDIKNSIGSLKIEEKEEIEIISNLVSVIIKRRIELGLSQRDLAALTGIKQPAIARLETLGSIPRLDTLIKILKALGIKIDLVPDEEAVTA